MRRDYKMVLGHLGSGKIKRLFYRLFLSSGGFSAFKFLHRKQIIVLMYHHFCDINKDLTSNEDIKRAQSLFSEQLKFLKSSYHILSLEDIYLRLQKDKPLPDYTLALTIDDGYKDFYTIAYPILQREEIPASLFISTYPLDNDGLLPYDLVTLIWDKARSLGELTEFINICRDLMPEAIPGNINDIREGIKRSSWGKLEETLEKLKKRWPIKKEESSRKFTLMDWKEVREVSRHNISVGAHSIHHLTLTELTLEEAYHEISGSQNRIEEELGRAVTLFCYPTGYYNPSIKALVKKTGFIGSVCSASLGSFNCRQDIDFYATKRIGVDPYLSLPFYLNICGLGTILGNLKNYSKSLWGGYF